ncbi:MAG: hypothetical protein SF187_07380 [Deltaproteobacteria bacterium]|nr:hypothetical protein [Deltaproteobacteria bacterium]
MKARERLGRHAARRAFVKSAAALAIPIWIRAAFADEACPGGKAKPARAFMQALRWDQLLSAAFARAAAVGKPLLVFVAKEHDWGRAHAFGELLNHGGDEALALLGLCEVVCAPMFAINRLAPQTPPSSNDPLMVLIETEALPARTTNLDVTLPDPYDVELEGDSSEKDWAPAFARRERKQDELISLRIRLLTELLNKGLTPSKDALLVRADQARNKLGTHNGANTFLKAQAITANEVATNPQLADVVLAAAASLLAQSYAAQGSERGRLTHLVAEASRMALCHRRIAGSRWAQANGCGLDIEWLPGEKDDSMFGFACGMGHVPARSRRILDFLTFDSQDERGTNE